MAKIIGEYRILLEGEMEDMPADKDDRNYYANKELPDKLTEILSGKIGNSCKVVVDPVSVVITD